jgi:hypothetical protein
VTACNPCGFTSHCGRCPCCEHSPGQHPEDARSYLRYLQDNAAEHVAEIRALRARVDELREAGDALAVLLDAYADALGPLGADAAPGDAIARWREVRS